MSFVTQLLPFGLCLSAAPLCFQFFYILHGNINIQELSQANLHSTTGKKKRMGGVENPKSYPVRSTKNTARTDTQVQCKHSTDIDKVGSREEVHVWHRLTEASHNRAI